jgi:ElaB/YqjD/DUF883 family membrane-anchored ribosome-binding protein
MADDWSKLEEEWKDHPVGLVASVDCTADDGQPLCQEFEVQGFPTLLYGDPLAAESYDGERDYESLSEFAKQHISKLICSANRIEACDEADKKVIESLLSKSDDELEEIVTTVSDLVEKEETMFQELAEGLQKEYEELVKRFNNQLEEIKDQHHYNYVEQIMTIRSIEAMPTDEDETEEGEL